MHDACRVLRRELISILCFSFFSRLTFLLSVRTALFIFHTIPSSQHEAPAHVDCAPPNPWQMEIHTREANEIDI